MFVSRRIGSAELLDIDIKIAFTLFTPTESYLAAVGGKRGVQLHTQITHNRPNLRGADVRSGGEGGQTVNLDQESRGFAAWLYSMTEEERNVSFRLIPVEF